MSFRTLDRFIVDGTGVLPRMIRLADGPKYWLSVTSSQSPDGGFPVAGEYAWFDVLPSQYVLPPKSWTPYADPDAAGEYRQVPSFLVRALIAEHGGEAL